MQNPHTRSSAGGFSLIELLVVIAILSVVMLLSLPALTYARSAAKSVACVSNLRSLGQAMFSYTSDFDGRYPVSPAAGYVNFVGEAGIYSPKPKEDRVLNPYLNDNLDVAVCPLDIGDSHRGQEQPRAALLYGTSYVWGEGNNYFQTSAHTGVISLGGARVSQIRDVARKVMISDLTLLRILENDRDLVWHPTTDGKLQSAAVFVDGHAAVHINKPSPGLLEHGHRSVFQARYGDDEYH